MIEVLGIVKRFGRTLAVDGVTFAVAPGAVCGFLGPNGAGKSTTIRVMVGAMAADAGEVRVCGRSMGPGASEARRMVGYLPEESPLHPDLTVEEFVRFRAELCGVARGARRVAVDEALGRCNVLGVRRRLCGQLSKGFRQRVGLAAAVVHRPRVLVLDEPTSGLDPAQVLDFRALVKGLGDECAVLLSSHVLAEVEASCDQAVLITGGRVVAEGSIADLRRRGAGAAMVRAECARDASDVLRGIEGVVAAESEALERGWYLHRMEVGAADEVDRVCERIGSVLASAGIAVRRLERSPMALEDVFHRLLAKEPGP